MASNPAPAGLFRIDPVHRSILCCPVIKTVNHAGKPLDFIGKEGAFSRIARWQLCLSHVNNFFCEIQAETTLEMNLNVVVISLRVQRSGGTINELQLDDGTFHPH